MVGIGGGLIIPCTLGCGAGAVDIGIGSCTLSSGGTGDVVSIAVGGREMGAGLGAGWVIAWRIICTICV